MTPVSQRTPPGDDAVAERIRAAVATVEAPADLRRRIEAQRRSGRRAARRGAAVALAAAFAAALALVAFVREAGPGAPSLADATAVALRAPASALPAGGEHGTTLRAPTVDGVTFPSYAYSALDVRAAGMRRERVRGREVVAVSYDDGPARIGYAIVAAPAVGVPPRARTVTYRGRRFALLRSNGAAVVTWRRSGRTCVLASRSVSHERLLRVAAWRAPE